MKPDAFSNVFGEGEAILHMQDGMILVENRKYPYSSAAIRTDMVIDAKQNFRVRYCLKMAEEGKKACFAICNKIFYKFRDKDYIYYDIGEKRSVSTEGWVDLEACSEAMKGIEKIVTYFIQYGNDSLHSVLVKEITAENTEEKENVQTVIARQPFSVGAIRWDAYFSTDSAESNVSREVARALSPAEFHWRAPYFANVTEDGRITFHEATQAQFDEEAELAVKAGIDYFAYCWYRKNAAMSYARKQHALSKFREQIKMCAIINTTEFDEETMQELAVMMKKDFYLKFDGHPVVYVFDAVHAERSLRNDLTAAAEKEGIPKPYYIGMNANPQPFAVCKIISQGYDAVGSYGFVSDGKEEPYASFALRNETMCKLRYSFDEIDHVPLICMGHDFRPRIENPVSWMGGANYSMSGTKEEVFRHIRNILDLHMQMPLNKPNTVLTYAWNEHDEGGWLCPTLPLNENGEAKPGSVNDDYYQAFRRAVWEAKLKQKDMTNKGETGE